MKKRKIFMTIFLYSFLIIVSLLFVFPIIISSFESFVPLEKQMGSFGESLTNLTLRNYIFIFKEGSFGKYLMNSIIVSLSTVILVLSLGCTAAYGLVRSKFKASNSLLTWILGLRMFPPVAVVIPFFMIVVTFRQIDKLSTLILLNTAFNLPLVIWILAQFIREIPVEYEEAAAIDGCNEFQLFGKIAFPLFTPGLVSAAVLTFIFSWNEFIFALCLTNIKARTVTLSFVEYISPVGIQFGHMYAGLVVAVLPVLIFLFLLNKYLIKGLLSMGGISRDS